MSHEQKAKEDTAIAGMLGFGAILLLTWVFEPQITAAVFRFRLFELQIIQHIPYQQEVTEALIKAIPDLSSRNEGYKGAWEISRYTGIYTRWIVTPILLLFAWLFWKSNKARKYKKHHSLKSLLEQRADYIPSVRPIIGLDILNMDIRKGPWASAKTAREFAEDNNLILTKADEISVDSQKALLTFTNQLNKRVASVYAMPNYKRALIAGFLARTYGGQDGKKSSDKLFSQYSTSFWKCKKGSLGELDVNLLNMDGVDEVIKNFQPQLDSLTKYHRYENTLVSALYVESWNRGIITTSDFIWLRPVDRTLWYSLNSQGRQTPFFEGLGTVLQLEAETRLKNKGGVVLEPELTMALSALEAELKKEGHIKDESYIVVDD